MFGLAQQVGGAHLRVGGVVGDDQRLGRAGEQIDADAAEQLPLGLGDERVARTDQHVHRRDRLRAQAPSPRPPGCRRADRSRPPRPSDIAATVAAGGTPFSGGVQAATRFTPATFAVSTDICAEATIG